MRTKLRKRVRVTAGLLALVFAIALACGTIYQQLAHRRDRQRFPQIGRSIDIGGRTLNLYCSGEGTPIVILESGGAGPGALWMPIQTELAKFTRSCWYDRAGEGWSDPGPFPHTSAAIAGDLH